MDKIMKIYRKIRKDSKLLSATVAVLSALLVGVVVLFFCLPEIQAATTNNVTWTPTGTRMYELSALQDGDASNITATSIAVEAGQTYTIDGTGVERNNVNITFNYTSNSGTDAQPAEVTIHIVNVDIKQSLDVSAFRFSTNGYPVEYKLIVQGECSIESTCQGALYPLIAVEDTSYSVYKLHANAGSGNNVEDFVSLDTLSKSVSLKVAGQTPVSKLTLTNASGSYGALIGSGEKNTFAAESVTEIQSLIKNLNDQFMLQASEQIDVTNTSIAASLKAAPYKFVTAPGYDYTFFPQYTYNSTNGASAGKITVGNLDGSGGLILNLTNNGYGAAIGGGGCSTASGKGATAKKVTVNAGTITFNSPTSYLGSPVFGSGVAKGAASPESTSGTFGGIEINGGSVYLGNYANKFGNTLPVNKNGDRLYEIKANTYDGTYSIADIDNFTVDDPFPIEYEYDPSLQFDFDLERMTSSLVAQPLGMTRKILDLDIILSPTLSYMYDGSGHNDRYTLHFWLPAVQTTALVITDEFGPGYTDFTLYTSGRVEVEPINPDETSADSRRYVLVRDQTYYLVAENIPSGLKVKNVALTADGRVTSAYYDTAFGYRIDASTSSITAEVSYSGSIDINFDLGFDANDTNNHNIQAPVASYEYGTETYTLPNLGTVMKDTAAGQVTDLVFRGWIYTDSAGNELGYITHITKTQQLDGNMKTFNEVVQSDGEIYLKALWSVQVEYFPGDDADVTGNLDKIVVDYAYGTGAVLNVNITAIEPQKDTFAFMGWSLDDGTDLYLNGSTVAVSTYTSHGLYANYERTGFSVYIDSSALSEDYAELSCVGSSGTDILRRRSDGSLATVVIDGKTYYYTSIVRKGSQVRVVISTKHGYKMENTSVVITGSQSSRVSTDSITGECLADVTVEDEDIFMTTDATFSPIEYEIMFKDGKEPNELLWSGYTFSFNIEDIADGKTIGDIIREGLNVTQAEMSDAAISAFINRIDKNTRFTDFSGWSLPLYTDTLSMDKTIASIYDENNSLVYGDMVFTAVWTEYDKFVINMNLFERDFFSDGSYLDRTSDKLKAVLYYSTDGSTMVPIYTEEIMDSVTGEEKTIAYAKAGDKIEIALFRMNSKGNPIGQPVATGIKLEELYYEYESKLNEWIHADIRDGSKSFTIKDDVKDETVIEVYMSYSLKEYNIIYWDIRGFDNSANPTTYTIFDEFDFTPLTDGVKWMLVTPDDDQSNDDDIKTEIIYGLGQDGKLITNGTAGNRDYISNLVLKPDWSTYTLDSYKIDILLEQAAFGNVSILYPQRQDEFFANDMIILSVQPRDGYKLVSNSLIYKKNNVAGLTLLDGARTFARDIDSFIIPPVDAGAGTYLFTMPSSDIVVSALFELCQYNITYSDITEDVVNTNPNTYNVNSEIVLADAQRPGYNFLGWYDADGNRIVKIVGRTGDMVLTPMFELADNSPEGDINGDNNNPGDDSGNENETNKPSDDNVSDKVDINKPTGDNSDNDKPSNDKVSVSGRPSNVVSRPSTNVTINGEKPNDSTGTLNGSGSTGGTNSGDTADIPRLLLICAAAVLVLMIIFLKKPNKDDEDEE